MALETSAYINGLVATNPTVTDPVAQGDDHIRLIKSCLLASFPGVTGAVTVTHTQLNDVVNKVVSGGALGTPSSGMLINCTFPALNQDTTGTAAKANALQSATTTVNVSSATAPTSGQVLTATSGTAATWQTPASGSGVSLSGTNTWTGAQTFTNSLMKLLGSSTGATTFASANSSATNYTITFPAETFEVGYKNIPQITKVANGAPTTGADLTYAGKHIYHTSTAGTFTIPANSSVAYPVGTALTFINANGAGNLTIAITTDTLRLAVAGTTASAVLAANGVATAIKVTATEWVISGSGLS